MIHDSSPWKTALLLDADLIERWANTPRRSERRSILVERKIFLSAYGMRKLDDAAKLSSETLANPIRVERFLPIKAGYSARASHKYSEYFDIANPKKVGLRRRTLLDVLIHSLVFVELLGGDDTLEGFLVTSDKDHANGLVRVEMSDFIDLMRRAAKDYPSVVHHSLDHKGRWRIWAGNGELRKLRE